jgi:hypothetical protein
LLGLASAVVRIPLETVLVASVGVAVGSFTRYRIAAMLAAILFCAAYFGGINLARLLTTDPFLRLLLDTALPLVAPLPLIALCYWAARKRIAHE